MVVLKSRLPHSKQKSLERLQVGDVVRWSQLRALCSMGHRAAVA